MHVIARPILLEAERRYPDCADWLARWRQVSSASRWTRLSDVRNAYRAADQVDRYLVFNVRGNPYRLICRVSYANKWQRGTLLITALLTHTEYDKNEWRKDCT